MKGVCFILILSLLIFFSLINSISATHFTESLQWNGNLTNVTYPSLAFGDLDNNGYPDLVLTGCSFILSGFTCTTPISKIYMNNGTTLIENPTWEQNLTAINRGSLSIGDINNDGKLDLVLAGCSSGGGYLSDCGNYSTKVYINNGTTLKENSTWQQNLTNVNFNSGSIALGDINNDGKLDLALAGADVAEKNGIYMNNGTTFVKDYTWLASLPIVGQITGGASLVWIDLNNDGRLDLAFAGSMSTNFYANVYINNGTSLVDNSSFANDFTNTFGFPSLATGDYNNDGFTDLVVIGTRGGDHIRFFNNTGNTFNLSQENLGMNNLIGIFDGAVALGDYNNDGYLDLATNGREIYTDIYTNTYGIFDRNTTEGDVLTDLRFSFIGWADINKDNNLDLIESGDNGNNFYTNIYTNNYSSTKNNTLPTPPSILLSNYSNIMNTLTLGWNNGSDNETPSTGLYYNLMIGNSTNNNTIVSGIYGGSSNPTAGYFGNMMQRKNITLNFFLPAGTYYWYVQTIDTGLAKGNWSARQTITVSADTTKPIISSTSSSVTTSTATITWTTDEMANSTVYYGTTNSTSSKSTDVSLTQSHSITLNSLSASTLYYYNVSGCDYSGNCNTSQQYNFTTSATEAAPGNSPGGSGSVSIGGGVASFWTNTIIIGNENISAGIEKDLGKGQRIQLNVSGEVHYVGVVNVNSTLGKTTINISSNPIQITLGIGEETKVDISEDGFYDIYVKLNNITNNQANLTIMAIHEEIARENQTIENNETDNNGKENQNANKLVVILAIVGGAIILIVTGIVLYLKLIRRKRK